MHLRMNNLAKDYGKHRVLQDINLDVNEGEFCVLLGPSGCGKSTLLRMVAGLETISDGELTLSDKVLNDVHPRDRDMAMVFQNYALYPQMSVRQNMAYPLKLAKLPKDEREEKVEHAASILELTPYLDRKPGELSGGQRQRVAMGRAIVRNPKIFLMDEPLSNLDARLRAQMRIDIREIQQNLGATTLYVTHDQVEAMTMADRIVVMSAGRIQQIGSPDDIYENPANRFVAEFIGSPPMNFITNADICAKILKETGQGGLQADIGIRPEYVTLTKPDAPAIAFDAQCANVEPLGAETLCYFSFDKSGPDDRKFITRWSGNLRTMKGTKQKIYLPKDKIALFNQTDGERIPQTS